STVSKKFVSDILSYKFFNAIPKLNEQFREHQVNSPYDLLKIKFAAIEQENKAANLSRRKELEETEDYLSDASQDYSFEEENENAFIATIDEWEFPTIIGRIPDYDNGVLELIKFV